MSGEEFYQIHREVSQDFGISCRAWDELPSALQSYWDRLAFEQDLRDRPEPATVRDDERSFLDELYGD